METKKCPSCGEEGQKFYKNKSTKDGLFWACASCTNKQTSNRRSTLSPARRRDLLAQEKEQRNARKRKDPIRYRASYMCSKLRWGKGGTDRAEALLIAALDRPCPYCGEVITLKNASVDHKTPLKRSTKHTNEQRAVLDGIDNIHIVCGSCNRTKGALTHEQFTLLLAFLGRDKGMEANILTRLKASNFIWR